jgi:hypothetical protein
MDEWNIETIAIIVEREVATPEDYGAPPCRRHGCEHRD